MYARSAPPAEESANDDYYTTTQKATPDRRIRPQAHNKSQREGQGRRLQLPERDCLIPEDDRGSGLQRRDWNVLLPLQEHHKHRRDGHHPRKVQPVTGLS